MMIKNKFMMVLKYVLLVVLAFISVFPFIFMLLGMTNSASDIMAGRVMIGGDFVKNMTNLFASNLGFVQGIINSAIVATITTVLALVISSAAGYGFEVYRTKTRDKVFDILLLSMMVPFAALMIPLFKMFSSMNKMGLSFMGIDSFFSVIILSVCTAFLIFFFRQNVKSFPKDMVEAARVDGVGEFGIFWKIFMPSIKNT
ncbi:MAG: carbohydrate ABC transporter permease, partial [Erysipelotrichaceae bacterium]|nr:carbohydrate ABC transporter permease [Erysipelotrichaceae bacterium]